MKEIELGDTVKDIHTGFKGVAIVKSEFVNGCIQYDVTPPVDKEGKVVESQGIDSQSLKIVKRGKKGLEVDKGDIKKDKDFTGGPSSKPRIMRRLR